MINTAFNVVKTGNKGIEKEINVVLLYRKIRC